jgi:TRAP-type C4-dicarboxylate transport system permease small subunit
MFINQLSRLCGVIATALIAISILIVCQMVILRYGFAASTTWQTDVVIFGLVGATMIGSPYLLHRGAHVGVDLITNMFSTKIQRWFKVISGVAIFLVGASLAWTGTELTWEAYEGNWLSETVAEIPLWIAYFAMPFGFGLLALQAVADVIAVLMGFDDALPEGSSSH